MTTVNLNKNFSERNGKYSISYNNYSDIGIYTVSSEYYNVNYKEDLEVSVAISTEDGVVSDLTISVKVINIERVSKRRDLISFEVKQSVAKHIEQLKRRHNNVLDIDFVRDVVSFILNYNVCNRYEVVVEDEVETKVEDKVEEANVDKDNVIVDKDNVIVDKYNVIVDEVIKPKKVYKVGFDRGFSVKVNGLSKSYSCSTEEIETSYGYTDLICRLEAKSTILIDGEYALIRAYIEVYDGVVTYVNIGKYREHLQLESFLDSMTDKGVSKKIDILLDDIKYEASSYVGEKDINFAYSILAMVLNINSFDTDTYLYNNETYNIVDVA